MSITLDPSHEVIQPTGGDPAPTDAELANADTLRSRATTALTANANFLALNSPTNAQTLAQVKMLTRECNALIRLAVSALDDITNT